MPRPPPRLGGAFRPGFGDPPATEVIFRLKGTPRNGRHAAQHEAGPLASAVHHGHLRGQANGAKSMDSRSRTLRNRPRLFASGFGIVISVTISLA